MKTHWCAEEILYDGTPLESLWAYRRLGVKGDSIVAFVGPCDIPQARIVDLEDRLANATIFSRSMLHLIEERFDLDLESAIWRQRLLAAIVRDALAARTGAAIRRDGDDLFEGERKLSVSIATLTPVSTKIHFGINVVSAGTPVPAKGLADYRVEPRDFAREILAAYAKEAESIAEARCKVRGII